MKEVPVWLKIGFSILVLCVGKWITPLVGRVLPFPLGNIGEYVVSSIVALALLLFASLMLYLTITSIELDDDTTDK